MAAKVEASHRLRGVSPPAMFAELQRTAQMCYTRGLFQASRWAAEQAIAMCIDPKALPQPVPPPPSDPAASLPLLHLAARDLPQALATSEKLTSIQGRFLHLYCMYLEGEHQRNTSVSVEEMIAGKADQGNPHVLSIRRDLEAIPQGDRDAFILFLYGAVLAQLQLRDKAIEALTASINLMPCNLAAWQELIPLYLLDRLPAVPVHWMSVLFEALLFLEIRDGEHALRPLTELRVLFPRSAYLLSHTAVAYYTMRDFKECEKLFEEQIATFPKRTDQLETFSNQLHVQQKIARLAQLAQQAQQVAPYRPETACIVGNFYSLRNEHSKALASFIQALKFNRRFQSAWVLLGHEFAEVQHTNAAAQAYHRALAINPNEYRAWFGLGQIFDRILLSPRLSLFYYLRATRIKQTDQRIWCTLGFAMVAAKKDPAMIVRALTRAPDVQPAAEKLIELYTLLGQKDLAQQWAKKAAALRAAAADAEGSQEEGEEAVEGEEEAPGNTSV